MAPTFKHGVGTRVLFNNRDVSDMLNAGEVKATVDTADTTCFVTSTGGTTRDKTYIGGHRDATVDFDGLADASTAYVSDIFRQALQASTKPKVTFGPGAAVVGDAAVLVFGDVTDADIKAPAKDVVATSFSVQASEARFGYWLITPDTSRTSSGSQATVNDTMISTALGASTRGGVAHLHVVSATTSTGQVKVQHSTDGASWADLLTFNISSGRSVARSTVAGSVKEKLRGTVVKTQASGITLGLAFARHTRRSTSAANP